MAQWQRIRLPIQEMQVWYLGQEDPLEKKMTTHSRILAWRIPWAKEPGRLQSMRFQRVRHDLATKQQLNYIYFSIYHGATCTGGPICLWSWRWIFVSAMWKSECLRGQDTEDVYHFNSKRIKQQVIHPLSFCLSLKWSPSPKIHDGESSIHDGKDTLLMSRALQTRLLGAALFTFCPTTLNVFSSPLRPGSREVCPGATWKLYRTAILISTRAWSFHREDVFLMSKFIFLATSWKGKETQTHRPGLLLGFRLKRDWASITNKILH